jgi:hypothetical protein
LQGGGEGRRRRGRGEGKGGGSGWALIICVRFHFFQFPTERLKKYSKYVYYVLKIYINSFKNDLETFTFYALVRQVYVLVMGRDYNGAGRHKI